MIKWTDVAFALLSIPVSAIIGGLISCLERFASAVLSGSRPPFFFRPFADAFARRTTKGSAMNRFQMLSVALCLMLDAAACAILFTRDDLLFALFLFIGAYAVLIAGAAGLNSPYARLGARHESYKLLLVGIVILTFFAICVRQVAGSFLVAGIFLTDTPLLYRLPLIFPLVAVLPAVKAGMSPFRFSEFLRIEFNGSQTAMLEIAGWFERTFLFGLVFIFAAGNLIGGIALTAIVFALQAVSDRFLSDIRPRTFLRWGIVTVLFLTAINILWIFLGGVIS